MGLGRSLGLRRVVSTNRLVLGLPGLLDSFLPHRSARSLFLALGDKDESDLQAESRGSLALRSGPRGVGGSYFYLQIGDTNKIPSVADRSRNEP